MTAEKKKLIVNLFDMNTVNHITHGLWRLPDNQRYRINDVDYWIELAELLEDGGFDSIFLADVLGAYDVFRDGLETALRVGVQIPVNDPLLLIPAMAAATKRLGFGVTFSTTYEPPFAFARRMSTLDHLTKGRVGWNIVTSHQPNAAQNFGLDEEIEKGARYAIADEYLDVLYKLWEGSWDDGAVVRDIEANVYTDPTKVRYINHVGEHFRVKGPHLTAPSPQRTPVLFQATGSPAGTAFAGKHAEAVFTGGRTLDDLRRNMQTMRDSAVAHGRDAGDIRFIVQASVIVGRTEAEAADKLRSYREHQSIEGFLTHANVPVDLLAYDPATPIQQVVKEAADAGKSLPYFAHLTGTVGEALADFGPGREDRFLVAGTPTVVADEIERWIDEAGIDGINLRQYHSFDTARDFAELVVPELRKRGRLHDDTPTTLRERLFGGGPRLPENHYGTRYRGGANLTSE